MNVDVARHHRNIETGAVGVDVARYIPIGPDDKRSVSIVGFDGSWFMASVASSGGIAAPEFGAPGYWNFAMWDFSDGYVAATQDEYDAYMAELNATLDAMTAIDDL